LSVLAPDGSWTTYTSEDSGLLNDYVNALAIDEAGRVWVGTDGGLSVLTPDGSWTTYTSRNSGLVAYSIEALAIDAVGRVWAGTNGGLSVLAPDGSWTTYALEDSGLANNSINALAIDAAGRVWAGAGFTFGGSDGLSRFDERAVTSRSILQTVADVVSILRLARNLAAATFVILSIGWLIDLRL
jgi:ligand-binding sensor domain-containing protein